jgi:hypothetical protein
LVGGFRTYRTSIFDFDFDCRIFQNVIDFRFTKPKFQREKTDRQNIAEQK